MPTAPVNSGAMVFPGSGTTTPPASTANAAPFVGPVAPTGNRRATTTTPTVQVQTPTNTITATQSVTRPNQQPAVRPAAVPSTWTARPYGMLTNGDWVWQWSAPAATPQAATTAQTTTAPAASRFVGPWESAAVANDAAKAAAAIAAAQPKSNKGPVFLGVLALLGFLALRSRRKGGRK